MARKKASTALKFLIILLILEVCFNIIGNIYFSWPPTGLQSNTVPWYALIYNNNGTIAWSGWIGDFEPVIANTHAVACPLVKFNGTYFTYSCNGVLQNVHNPLPPNSVTVQSPQESDSFLTLDILIILLTIILIAFFYVRDKRKR